MKKHIIVRNQNTGISHKVGNSLLSGNKTKCGTVPKQHVRVSAFDAEQTSSTMFCKTCFPDGKSEALTNYGG